MKPVITCVDVAAVPARRPARTSKLDAIVKSILALPAGKALRLPVASFAEARRLAPRLYHLVTDRGKGCRVRTADDAVYVWLEPDSDAAAVRCRRSRRGSAA